MKSPALVGAVLSLMVAAAPAFAQPNPYGAAPDGGQAPQGAGGFAAARAEWRARAAARRQARAQDLAIVLRLRPDQQGAWQAFQAAVMPEGREHGHSDEGRHDDAAPLTTPQAIDKMTAKRAERQARVDQVLQATKRFYAALSPEQQQVFDALMRLRHGHEGGGMHMGGPGHGGGMGAVG